MRSSELTRKRILDAATSEFAAHGVAGARVDRIARAAGANKNLLYVYFGSKEKLFQTVLRLRLFAVYEAVPFTADDLPRYAGRLFDFCMEAPELVRLLTWFGLEKREGRSEWPTEPGTSLAAKLEAMEQARVEGKLPSELPPAFLLTAILTLASAWTEINPYALSIDPSALDHRAETRAAVVRAIASLAQGALRKA